MRQYDSYRGVEWIGKIPSHWEIGRLGYTAMGKGNLFIDGDWIESPVIIEEGIRYVTTGNVTPFVFKNEGNSHISEETFKKLNCTEVYPGDILISRLNEPLGKACIVPDIGERLITSVDCVIYRPDSKKYNKKFMVYYLNNSLYTEFLSTIGRGAIMKRVARSTLEKTPVILPPLKEQEAIASYLDAETARIDGIIEARAKKIKLLEELRNAVISKAVTNGINDNVESIDSGVDWIGRTPKHWKKCRFKNITSFIAEPSTSSKKIGLENIESKTGKFVESETDFEGNGTAFMEDDVVYGKLRPYLQKVWLATFEGNAVGDFFVYRCKENCLPKYLHYLMLSDGFTSVCNGATFGAKMPRVPSDFINSMSLYLPSVEEQNDIINYLDTKISKIFETTEKHKKEIDFLKEYRSSLITEVVTGKRKVVL